MNENSAKNILVAPLNWGLGHATRCIPLVNALLQNGFNVILASDGDALTLLKKEFPDLLALELPSYNIEYPKNGADFKWKMIKNTPILFDAVVTEKKVVKKWVKQYRLSGIISDNRLGVLSKKVPSVFMTHQVNVLSGSTTWASGWLHRMVIARFIECWIPDVATDINLSGKLGHMEDPGFDIQYIGPLSRFEKKQVPMIYDLMVVLSGPEPQRTMLEDILSSELATYEGKVVFVRGVVSEKQEMNQVNDCVTYNFMTTDQLEQTLNESKVILCRSGYTTIMDLSKLEKKAFFIPTPGQYEQEYLAKKMKKAGLAPYAKQQNFKIANLAEVASFKGMQAIAGETHWKNLFCLFEGE